MLQTNNLEHILAAGQWANHMTFTSHYLIGNDKLYRLGPIVAAQTVVVPPRVRCFIWVLMFIPASERRGGMLDVYCAQLRFVVSSKNALISHT